MYIYYLKKKRENLNKFIIRFNTLQAVVPLKSITITSDILLRNYYVTESEVEIEVKLNWRNVTAYAILGIKARREL